MVYEIKQKDHWTKTDFASTLFSGMIKWTSRELIKTYDVELCQCFAVWARFEDTMDYQHDEERDDRADR